MDTNIVPYHSGGEGEVIPKDNGRVDENCRADRLSEVSLNRWFLHVLQPHNLKVVGSNPTSAANSKSLFLKAFIHSAKSRKVVENTAGCVT